MRGASWLLEVRKSARRSNTLNKLWRSDRVRLIHYSIFGLEAAEHAESCCIETYAQVSSLAVSVTISTTDNLLYNCHPPQHHFGRAHRSLSDEMESHGGLESW